MRLQLALIPLHYKYADLLGNATQCITTEASFTRLQAMSVLHSDCEHNKLKQTREEPSLQAEVRTLVTQLGEHNAHTVLQGSSGNLGIGLPSCQASQGRAGSPPSLSLSYTQPHSTPDPIVHMPAPATGSYFCEFDGGHAHALSLPLVRGGNGARRLHGWGGSNRHAAASAARNTIKFDPTSVQGKWSTDTHSSTASLPPSRGHLALPSTAPPPSRGQNSFSQYDEQVVHNHGGDAYLKLRAQHTAGPSHGRGGAVKTGAHFTGVTPGMVGTAVAHHSAQLTFKSALQQQHRFLPPSNALASMASGAVGRASGADVQPVAHRGHALLSMTSSALKRGAACSSRPVQLTFQLKGQPAAHRPEVYGRDMKTSASASHGLQQVNHVAPSRPTATTAHPQPIRDIGGSGFGGDRSPLHAWKTYDFVGTPNKKKSSSPPDYFPEQGTHADDLGRSAASLGASSPRLPNHEAPILGASSPRLPPHEAPILGASSPRLPPHEAPILGASSPRLPPHEVSQEAMAPRQLAASVSRQLTTVLTGEVSPLRPGAAGPSESRGVSEQHAHVPESKTRFKGGLAGCVVGTGRLQARAASNGAVVEGPVNSKQSTEHSQASHLAGMGLQAHRLDPPSLKSQETLHAAAVLGVDQRGSRAPAAAHMPGPSRDGALQSASTRARNKVFKQPTTRYLTTAELTLMASERRKASQEAQHSVHGLVQAPGSPPLDHPLVGGSNCSLSPSDSGSARSGASAKSSHSMDIGALQPPAEGFVLSEAELCSLLDEALASDGLVWLDKSQVRRSKTSLQLVVLLEESQQNRLQRALAALLCGNRASIDNSFQLEETVDTDDGLSLAAHYMSTLHSGAEHADGFSSSPTCGASDLHDERADAARAIRLQAIQDRRLKHMQQQQSARGDVDMQTDTSVSASSGIAARQRSRRFEQHRKHQLDFLLQLKGDANGLSGAARGAADREVQARELSNMHREDSRSHDSNLVWRAMHKQRCLWTAVLFQVQRVGAVFSARIGQRFLRDKQRALSERMQMAAEDHAAGARERAQREQQADAAADRELAFSDFIPRFQDPVELASSLQTPLNHSRASFVHARLSTPHCKVRLKTAGNRRAHGSVRTPPPSRGSLPSLSLSALGSQQAVAGRLPSATMLLHKPLSPIGTPRSFGWASHSMTVPRRLPPADQGSSLLGRHVVSGTLMSSPPITVKPGRPSASAQSSRFVLFGVSSRSATRSMWPSAGTANES